MFNFSFKNKRHFVVLFCLLVIPLDEVFAHQGGGSHTFFSETGLLRINMISFFLALLVFCSYFIKNTWNQIRVDFLYLPRLTFKKSFLITSMIGLLLLVFMTFTIGANKFITAETWSNKTIKESSDHTQQEEKVLNREEDEKYVLSLKRKLHLQQLKDALWKYASENEGDFPESIGSSEFPDEYWILPELYELKYQYFKGLKPSENKDSSVLVSELNFYHDGPFILKTDGEISQISKEKWKNLQTTGAEK